METNFGQEVVPPQLHQIDYNLVYTKFFLCYNLTGDIMKLIFGTTNARKTEDLQNIINELGLDIEVLSMSDIGWDRGEIDENGSTIEENSLIKAQSIYDFCVANNIQLPILTDDAGLFVEVLGDEPGIYTARYADDELALDSSLPKHQCVLKLLRKLNNEHNRKAKYRCCVTCMMPSGEYFQEVSESEGTIAEDIIGELKKPYFYSVFVLNGTTVAFNELGAKELKNTYRYTALRKSLKRL